MGCGSGEVEDSGFFSLGLSFRSRIPLVFVGSVDPPPPGGSTVLLSELRFVYWVWLGFALNLLSWLAKVSGVASFTSFSGGCCPSSFRCSDFSVVVFVRSIGIGMVMDASVLAEVSSRLNHRNGCGCCGGSLWENGGFAPGLLVNNWILGIQLAFMGQWFLSVGLSNQLLKPSCCCVLEPDSLKP